MIYVASRIGLHHEVSEDSILIGSHVLTDTAEVLCMPKSGFVCVADGVGGNQGGAQASQYVLEALAEAENTNVESLRELLVKTNNTLIKKAKEDEVASRMATTLTGIFVQEGAFHLIHVGNTRAFVKQGRYFKQITSDHTTYNWLKSIGQIEAAEACNKNEITNCLGGADPALLSKLVVSDIPPFSLMVLTSDGVHEYVDLDTLENILIAEGTYRDKCE